MGHSSSLVICSVFLIFNELLLEVKAEDEDEGDDSGGGNGLPGWISYGLIIILLMLSALFSGLTLGLMGLDKVPRLFTFSFTR